MKAGFGAIPDQPKSDGSGIVFAYCKHCGKQFRPCPTEIPGIVNWRKSWCSPECYQNALRAEMTIEPIKKD